MMPKNKKEAIEERKLDHLKIVFEEDVGFLKTNWLEYVEPVHSAIPEVDFISINTQAKFLKRVFSAPIVIESMTGGTKAAAEINARLAKVAEMENIPMGVGSQRIAIEKPELAYTFSITREVAPKAFLMANLGAAQVIKHGEEFAWKAIKMIEADALIIHSNPLQELIQPSGDTYFSGLLHSLKKISENIDVPLIVKEVGCGISLSDAIKLRDVGVAAIDTAGAGGTNWAKIEGIRARKEGDVLREKLAMLFQEWGIPTAASVAEISQLDGIEVIGSGGIRNGLEIAKVIMLGAEMAGLANPFLKAAKKGEKSIKKLIEQLLIELKTTMFLVGAKDIASLSTSQRVIFGPLKIWLEQRLGSLKR
ncbi:MAG: type 2 isopentenyl-diphosphate Delta-isomerase [Nitrososphaerota archaeon]